MCWLEWARQADFPGKLDLFPFSQVESRKSNGLTNWQVGMRVVLCKDIQAGTTDWWRPVGSCSHHDCSGRETEACRERGLLQERSAKWGLVPKAQLQGPCLSHPQGCCASMPWALSQSVLFCTASHPKIRQDFIHGAQSYRAIARDWRDGQA